LIAGALACGAIVAGCGSSSPTTTARQVATIPFKSSALEGLTIPVRYTCDGKDDSLPVEWGAVPPSTQSLVLFVVGLTPEPSTGTYALSVEWALAGVNPTLHKIDAGQVPLGAYPGMNSAGNTKYRLCPKRGSTTKYQFELYGLPGSERVAPKFGALAVIRELEAAGAPINAHGRFFASYTRI
jgi:phosphatidylethanolamine-binding protein (PEBP) family uncharacterized protein